MDFIGRIYHKYHMATMFIVYLKISHFNKRERKEGMGKGRKETYNPPPSPSPSFSPPQVIVKGIIVRKREINRERERERVRNTEREIGIEKNAWKRRG